MKTIHLSITLLITFLMALISIPVMAEGTNVVSPEEQIDNIQDIFDNAVISGTLTGVGSGNSAVGRLKALRNMLERAEQLIDLGLDDEAIQQLQDVYNRIDGNLKPSDFASGSQTGTLMETIMNIIQNIRA